MKRTRKSLITWCTVLAMVFAMMPVVSLNALAEEIDQPADIVEGTDESVSTAEGTEESAVIEEEDDEPAVMKDTDEPADIVEGTDEPDGTAEGKDDLTGAEEGSEESADVEENADEPVSFAEGTEEPEDAAEDNEESVGVLEDEDESVSLFADNTEYTVTVINGTGSGQYAAGEKVTIRVIEDERPDYGFEEWISDDGITFDDYYGEFQRETTFTMPAKDVTVTAKIVIVGTILKSLTLGENTWCKFNNYGSDEYKYGYHPFTPEKDGRYCFYTLGEDDADGELWKSRLPNRTMDWPPFAYADACSGEGKNFYFECDLKANTTYYFCGRTTYGPERRSLFVEQVKPTITTEPSAADLVYTGDELALITGGEAVNGTIYYAGTDTDTKPALEEFGDAIPKRKDPGDFYAWYWVDGDEGYADIGPVCIPVMIKAPVDAVSGDGGEWKEGSSEGLTITFKSNCTPDLCNKENFDGIRLDDSLAPIDPSNYDLKFGSVIITLKPSYLKTLSEGTHTISAVFTKDGKQYIEAGTATIKIKKNHSDDDDEPAKKTDTVVTCQMAGYPSNYAWNEAAKACQAGYLDDNGVFHSTANTAAAIRAGSVPNTADAGITKNIESLIGSLMLAVIAAAVLRKNR